ncbi:MAG: FkbM family methyltransferase [Betaproteobacteria bacterium]
MPFVSHAQNGEDVLLWRALRDVAAGTYIDVGANDPERDSVTRAFYDRGWSGVNVEPVGSHFERLRQARPRDVNLRVAVGAGDGELAFFEIPDTGLSTLDAAVAERHRAAGFAVVPIRVPVRTLSDIWSEHVAGDVHFLKIDVEGTEADVLAGANLRRQRPWIVVVESTAPLTRIARHATWERLLTDADYLFVWFDGLNRYYVAAERADLTRHFDGPPGERDDFVRAAELVASDSGLPEAAQFDPARFGFLDLAQPEPTLATPTSQLCTASQFGEPVYGQWCEALGEVPLLHRKLWEFAYAMQALERHGMLADGKRGLGFGCGKEPMPAAMAARGCEIVATDLDAAAAAGSGWIESHQHAATKDDLNDRGLCDPDRFRRNVSFRAVDMNAIPADLGGFDFVWSSCAFEHLGSIAHGLRFVANAMRCLKPGGVAVHTTEFNLSSNFSTVEAKYLVLFRRSDIEQLVGTLERDGHVVAPLNFNPGARALDRYVDLPPFRSEPHLRLRIERFVATSIGLIVRRAP